MSTTLSSLFQSGVSKRFDAGQLIMNGQDESGVFLITEGFVKVYSISDEGLEYLHVIYKKNEIFPLIWALRDTRRRVFYEAVSTTTVTEISKKTFNDALKNDGSPSHQILAQLAEQFNIYADRLDNLQYKKAYEKVVFRILFLAGRFGSKTPAGWLIKAPITHELIAQSINLARESVSRQIEKLETKGYIEYRQGQILIKDIKALSREFSEPVSLDLWGLG